MALEFDTAVARVRDENEAPEERPSIEFTINERDPDTDEILDRVVCHAYYPGEGKVLVLMTDVMGRRAGVAEKLAGIIDFFADVLDPDSKDYVVRRLLDDDDPFGLEDIQPIVFGLVEEWGGRPTKSPSDFAPSRKTGGRNSTPRTSKSTSSGSRSTASSTRRTRTSSRAS
jgi:hypothetical protein